MIIIKWIVGEIFKSIHWTVPLSQYDCATSGAWVDGWMNGWIFSNSRVKFSCEKHNKSNVISQWFNKDLNHCCFFLFVILYWHCHCKLWHKACWHLNFTAVCYYEHRKQRQYTLWFCHNTMDLISKMDFSECTANVTS